MIKLNLLFSLGKSKLNLFRGYTLLYSVVKQRWAILVILPSKIAVWLRNFWRKLKKQNSIFRKALDKNKIKFKIKIISLRKN